MKGRNVSIIQKMISLAISLLLVAISNPNNLETKDSTQAPSNEGEYVYATLPDHERPIGYDDPVLTDVVAKEIFLEAKHMQYLISHSATTDVDRWVADTKNQVYYDQLDSPYGKMALYYYFVPELSNMDAFDRYFGQVFTDDTLERLKTQLDIYEYNGRVVGVNFASPASVMSSSLQIWEESIVTGIQQDEQTQTATVSVHPYYYEYEFSLVERVDYTFEYSEEWGWRIVLNKFSDM